MTQSVAAPARVRMPVDIVLFGATLALVVIGLWMVFDTSYVRTLDNARLGHDAFYFVKKQAVGAIVGLFALFAMMRIGYWGLRRWAVPLMFLAIVSLCCVWVPGLGVRQNNALRWIDIGPVILQPSEYAKVALLIYLAALLSRPDLNVRYLGERGLSSPLFVSAVTLLLIEREPDLGTAFVLFLAVLTQLFLAGARKRHLALICLVCGLAVVVIGFRGHSVGHRSGRITSFLNPAADKTGQGFQVYHSRLAVGSGGWMGQGLGQGKEKFYIPQANSDFIFATLAEEFGFIRTVPVLLLLFLVGWRGFRIAWYTKDRFGSLLAGGIAALISWQALVNIGVATASIPATGVPLPFISLGSTSLVFLMASIGILLNIAQHPTPPAATETGNYRGRRGSQRKFRQD
jgi:cell division protein FtsW